MISQSAHDKSGRETERKISESVRMSDREEREEKDEEVRKKMIAN